MSEIASPEGSVQGIPELTARVYEHAIGALSTFWALKRSSNDPDFASVSPDISVMHAIGIDKPALWVYGLTAKTPHGQQKPDQFFTSGYITVEGANIKEADEPTAKPKLNISDKFTVQRTIGLLLEDADESTAVAVAQKAISVDKSNMPTSRAKEYLPSVATGFAASGNADAFFKVWDERKPNTAVIDAISRNMTSVACAQYNAETTKFRAMLLFDTLSQYDAVDPRQLVFIYRNNQPYLSVRYMCQPRLAPIIINAEAYKNYIGEKGQDDNRRLAGELLQQTLKQCQYDENGRRTTLAAQYEAKLFLDGSAARGPDGIPARRLIQFANAYGAYLKRNNLPLQFEPIPESVKDAELLTFAPIAYEKLLLSLSTTEDQAAENKAMVELFTVLLGQGDKTQRHASRT